MSKIMVVERVTAIALFTFLLFFITSATLTPVRCGPNSIERDIEIECKWKGAPVGANLKWTEPEEDLTTTTNADDGSKPKSGTTSSQANTAINTQQALMLTGASVGAALAGGGLLVKKKLEGSGSSEQETKQATSTTTTTSTSSTVPKYTSDSARSYREGLEPQQDELKSSSQGQSSAQSQQSNAQNPPKDGPPTTAGQRYMQEQMNSQSSQQSQPLTQTQRLEQSGAQTSTSSTIAASVTITKELLMQKQMDSLTKQSASSTSTQTGETQSKQGTASSASTTSQNIGLLASSSSAARMAAEMWTQRQKELERLAKQRAELAEKFSVPSYTGTGLSLASSMTSAIENAWSRLQGFSSALTNGFTKAWDAIKSYSKYIVPIVTAVIVVASIFLIPPAAPAFAGAGMGISISQGAGLVGAGILAGGITFYAVHNTIMNYPRQPSFEAEHTQIIEQSASELREEKGSGHYGEDVAQEQLDQADIAKDRIIEQHDGLVHKKTIKKAEEWLESKGQVILSEGLSELDPETLDVLSQYGKPDIITDDCIVECKKGTPDESYGNLAMYQAEKYVQLIKYLKKQGVEKTLVYWFDQRPTDTDWEKVIDYLKANGVQLMPEEIFGEG